MSLALKTYPNYDGSELPWVGTLPAHWKVERAKWLFQRMQRPVRAEDGVVTCFRDGIVTLRKNRRLDGFTESLKEIGYQGVRSGDLVIHAMDAFAGAIGVSDSDGKSTPVYAVCSPRAELNVHYYAHVVREMARSQWIAALATGIRERSTDFRYETFANQWLPFPPLEEQQAIASFLRSIDSRTKKLIRAKRRMIELLNEQKQAITHSAVTRGLNPSVCLKPSGVAWLEEVPKHWSLTPNRNLLRIRKVLVGSRHTEYQLLSLTKMGVIVRDVTTGRGKFSFFWERSQEVRPNDLVFCLFDVDETPRTVGLSRHLGMISGDYTVMEPSDQLAGAFIECFYKAMDDRKLLSPLYTGLRKRISKPLLLAAKTPMPPPNEQADIVRFIDNTETRVEKSIGHLRREISLLTEYRTRLIADVVTGKLDVRGVELPELDEAAEVEPLSGVSDEELGDSQELVAAEEGVDAD